MTTTIICSKCPPPGEHLLFSKPLNNKTNMKKKLTLMFNYNS